MAPTKPTKATKKPQKTTAGVQKSQRPSKRNLVRWNEDMDKKLLLTVQWACNKKGVKIPWDIVGKEMGETITESAVIQHLAKLRQRMVKDDLPVPPSLTRGGRNEKKTAVTKPTASRVSKRVSQKKEASRRGDEEEDSDSDGEYNSEEEITPKKTAKKGKKPATKTRVKKEESSPEHAFSRNDTDNESEQDMAEQSYAVGDGMWDLEAKDTSSFKAKHNASKSSGQSSGKELESEANHGASESTGPSSNPAPKSDASRMRSDSSGQSGQSSRYASMSDTHRVPSESSGQSPQQNSHVVKLRIGKEGFAKLQLSEQTYNTHTAEGSNHPSENAYSSSDAEDDENDKAMMHDGSGRLEEYGQEYGAGFGGGVEHLASGSGADYLAAQNHLPAGASETDYLAAQHRLPSYDHEMDVSQQNMAAYGSFPPSHMEAAAELRSINFGTPHHQQNFGYGLGPSHGYGNHFAGQAVSGMTHDTTYGGINGPTYTSGGVFSGHAVLPGMENQLPMGGAPFDHHMGFFESAYNGDATHYHADDFAAFASLNQHASGQGERSLGSPFQDPPRLNTFGQDQKSFESADLH